MSTQLSASVSLPAPVEPDSDFDALVARALTAIQYTQGTAGAWTDHNAHDPGITLLEVALWGLADLHYRTAARGFGGWNAEVRDWRGPGLRDVSRAREAHLARVALDRADVVEEVYAAAADDEAARAALGTALADEGLVEAEVAALVARERRRLLSVLLASRIDAIRTVAEGSGPGDVLDDLVTALPLDTHDALLALAVEPAPPAEPELWEDDYGRTTLWPPHPIQTRTCDPVTTGDYLRLARALEGVKRAWVVPGLGVGVRWDGTQQTVELPWRRGALTILVEPPPGDGPYRDVATDSLTAAGLAFLARVLEGVTGVAPVDEPAVSYRDKVIEPADGPPPKIAQWRSRRLLGDELCAALVCSARVVVGGKLEIAPTADEAATLGSADDALAAFFSADKVGLADPPPPPPTPVFPAVIDGPWPVPAPAHSDVIDRFGAPPASGWQPGEPVRVSEVVRLLQGVDGVIGVDGLVVAVDADSPSWQRDTLSIGRYCIPAYAHNCLCTRVVDPRSCDA